MKQEESRNEKGRIFSLSLSLFLPLIPFSLSRSIRSQHLPFSFSFFFGCCSFLVVAFIIAFHFPSGCWRLSDFLAVLFLLSFSFLIPYCLFFVIFSTCSFSFRFFFGFCSFCRMRRRSEGPDRQTQAIDIHLDPVALVVEHSKTPLGNKKTISARSNSIEPQSNPVKPSKT